MLLFFMSIWQKPIVFKLVAFFKDRTSFHTLIYAIKETNVPFQKK